MRYSEALPRLVETPVDNGVAFAPPPETFQLATYQRSVRALFARVRDIDIATYESAPRAILRDKLQSCTSHVLEDANHLLGELLEDCEPAGPTSGHPSAAFEPASGEVDLGSSYESGLADIAFIAQVELRHRAARLARFSSVESDGTLLAECDGALRRVTKALGAIDRALARAANTPTCLDLDFDSDLELSLRIRRTYARFRTKVLDIDVSACGSTSREHVKARLLATGREIAVLVGLPLYPFLRLADRNQLRGLQHRLIALLRAETLDVVASLRLRSDVVSFASMLAQVNRRQELFDHDSRIVIRVVASLTRLDALTEESAANLRHLEGRDEDVDTLLQGGRRDLAAWAPVLTRLAQELGNSRDVMDDL